MNPLLAKALIELGSYAVKELIDTATDVLKERNDNPLDENDVQVIKAVTSKVIEKVERE